MSAVTDGALVAALAALPAVQLDLVALEAGESAQNSALDPDGRHRPLAPVWRAVSELATDVRVAGSAGSGLLAQLGSGRQVARALEACPPDRRRVVAAVAAQLRDERALVGDVLMAEWWSALAVLVAGVDDTERRTLLALEDDAIGAHGVGALAIDGEGGYDA